MWAKEQRDFHLPLDGRSLRNRVSRQEEEVVTAKLAGKNVPPVIMEVDFIGDVQHDGKLLKSQKSVRDDRAEDILFLD